MMNAAEKILVAVASPWPRGNGMILAAKAVHGAAEAGPARSVRTKP